GKHKGKDKLSKMGRKRLKTAFFQAGLCLIANNDAFNQIYRYYTQERANPLIKMKGVIVIANKLIRVMYAMLKNNTAYDEQRMLADIQRDDQTAA
ncbi:MAG: IS110 family transposase, partial [Thermotogota bacterium]|nr:IS110 family transposase [Thermotogota bacterium]